MTDTYVRKTLPQLRGDIQRIVDASLGTVEEFDGLKTMKRSRLEAIAVDLGISLECVAREPKRRVVTRCVKCKQQFVTVVRGDVTNRWCQPCRLRMRADDYINMARKLRDRARVLEAQRDRAVASEKKRLPG